MNFTFIQLQNIKIPTFNEVPRPSTPIKKYLKLLPLFLLISKNNFKLKLFKKEFLLIIK